MHDFRWWGGVWLKRGMVWLCLIAVVFDACDCLEGSLGLPAGVLNLLPADREVSDLLVRHPGIADPNFYYNTALRLLDGHVNRPVVTRSYGTGECIASNLGREDWAQAMVEQTDPPLCFVHCSNAELG